MDNYLGLRLKLILKDKTSLEGTVDSIDDSAQKLSLINGKIIIKIMDTFVHFLINNLQS